MMRVLQYYSRFQDARGGFTVLPAWARAIVALLALPGLILIGLSIAALCIGILVVLALTVPVYRLLKLLTGGRAGNDVVGSMPDEMIEATVVESASGPARRPIEVKIIEP